MKTTDVAEKRAGYWWRVLRPLFWWLLLVLVLYGIRLHQRLMEQTRIKFSIILGESSARGVMASLDGVSVENGSKISLGHHVFSVSHPKAEPFKLDFFAWYGSRDLGRIQLKRSVGNVSFHASPPASAITITGPNYSTVLYDVTATNLIVPTDDYTIRAEYPHWSESQNVSVRANQTTPCAFTPHLGAIHITCNKEPATYHLQSHDGKVTGDGNLPATITGLPLGEYQLSASYSDSQEQRTVLVEVGLTNDMAIEFKLGTAHLESDPQGAEVRNADNIYLGKTPLDISDLKPQMTSFRLSLSGYEPISVSLEINANQTNFFRTNLLSLRYISAIQSAQKFMAAKNYDAVNQAIVEALNAKPDDAFALRLQAQANILLKAEQASLERYQRPKKVFDTICAQNADSGLFQEHLVKTAKLAKDVANAIALSLQDDQIFKVTMDDSAKPEIYALSAKQHISTGLLTGGERICVMVIGQAKDDETQIWFRVLEYQVQHTITRLNDTMQMVPLHPSRIAMTQALQGRINEGVDLISQEIRLGTRP